MTEHAFSYAIYPMLNQWNANTMTPNPALWLVESAMNIDENPFRNSNMLHKAASAYYLFYFKII